jgi:ribonuclease P protein component
MVFARAWPPRAVADCSPAVAPRVASASAPDWIFRHDFQDCLTIPHSIKSLKFEPRKRLHRPAEFRALHRHGKKFGDAYFSIAVLANHETHPRLGLSIATRTFGTAVARNRVKRLTRESFRLNQHSLPPVDVTVSAREAARQANSSDLRASLDKHWKSITQRCQT